MLVTFSIGNTTIHRIIEQEGPFQPMLEFLPGLTPDQLEANRSWLEPDALDPATGHAVLCFQSYVVRTPHRTILVDSCIGNHKDRSKWPDWHAKTDDRYMRNLAAVGLSVQDIDFVVCTHLHADHVGWNTRLVDGRWEPTFPNARYLFSEAELAFWTDRLAQAPNPVLADSVLPIVAANRATLVGTDHALDDHLRLFPTPGHTPHHCSVLVGKRGGAAVMTGDAIHSPLQMRYPELSALGDLDPALAATTRRALLERFCDTGILCCTAHFPSPSVGRISRWGTGFRCDPISV